MLVLVKACRTGPTYGPNDGEWIKQWTVCPGRRLVRQQLTLGYLILFSFFLSPKIRRFDFESSYFCQFKRRNITKFI